MNENYIDQDEKLIVYVEDMLKNMALKATFSNDVIRPFLKRAEATLYHERNKIPHHKDFTSFLNLPFNENNYAGTQASIQYFVWRWRNKMPKVIIENHGITVTL